MGAPRAKRVIKVIVIVVLGGFVLATSSVWCVRTYLVGTRRVQVFSLGQDRKIEIYVENEWEVTQPLLYAVWDDRGPTIPPCAFWYLRPSEARPVFRLITARGGDLAAIVTEEDPEGVVILHDFSSEFSYPWQTDDAESERSQALLKELQDAHPDLQLEFR